jgi:phosphoribosylpyrophosphate synthetase
MSQAQLGNKSNLGKSLSEETKAKMSEAKRGRKATEETRQRMSEAQRGNKNSLGKSPSVETRAKLSESLKAFFALKRAEAA